MLQSPPGPAVFWPPSTPQIGQRVFYRLSAADVRLITRQRMSLGIRAAAVRTDDVLPAVIVRVSGDGPEAPCNLSVFLDGPDQYWAQQTVCGETAGCWAWPTVPGV
jgi:hypothetical protein